MRKTFTEPWGQSYAGCKDLLVVPNLVQDCAISLAGLRLVLVI